MPRRLVRQISLAATVIAGIWAAALVAFDGFDLQLGSITLESHDPMRPFFWGCLALAIFVWANGVGRTADTWTGVLSRISHRAAIAALVLWTIVMGLSYAATAASASDAYGYLSQADLWIDGTLKVPQPWAAAAPWPEANWTFTPLGYRPTGLADDWNLAPVYSPGLPLLMAGMKLIGGHCAMFLIVPLFGGVLAFATYGIGRRLGAPLAGLIAAWFVATSPAYLFMLALPMIDVPVAALWTLAFFFLLRPGPGAALAAGVTVGFSVLVRPNLAPLTVVFLVWLLLDWRWSGATAVPARLVRIALFCVPVALGAVAIALLYQHLYGSPFRSGYGDLDVLFGWRYILPNVRNYFGWLVETQTALALVGLAALIVPLRQIWPTVADRRVFWILGLFVLVLWAEYLVYLPFDTWVFLRFLLPSWPLIMLGLASVLLAVARTRGAAGLVAVTWLVVALGAYNLHIAQQRGAFTLWQTDRAYIAAARLTQSVTDEKSVVFTLLHSGSVRYYGGRMTMRFDLLDKEWLDRAVAWLGERGIKSYALLDGSEVDDFKKRFADQQTAQRLADPPLFTYSHQGPPVVRLYDLSAPGRAAIIDTAIDPRSLRCAPPVQRPRLTLSQ
jgi:Dolichyl-phosphate-mannose-protein mannosyltransferase